MAITLPDPHFIRQNEAHHSTTSQRSAGTGFPWRIILDMTRHMHSIPADRQGDLWAQYDCLRKAVAFRLATEGLWKTGISIPQQGTQNCRCRLWTRR
jgi:hypothetical protein